MAQSMDWECRLQQQKKHFQLKMSNTGGESVLT